MFELMWFRWLRHHTKMSTCCKFNVFVCQLKHTSVELRSVYVNSFRANIGKLELLWEHLQTKQGQDQSFTIVFGFDESPKP